MARKKKEVDVAIEKSAKSKKTTKKYAKDNVPLTDSQIDQLKEDVPQPIEYEIDWEKIAADVREAALMVEKK